MSIFQGNLRQASKRFGIQNEKLLYVCVPAILLILFIAVGVAAGTSRFSPDSWSYYELSRTVFNGRFYEFNTWRSYFSDAKSASFPFGFPVVLGAAGKFLGDDPRNAIYINSLLAALTWSGVVRVCERIKLPKPYQLIAASSLVLNPAYLDEVFSGRAIPIAVALFVLAILASRERPLISGILFGLAALTRFDYLIYGLAGITGIILLEKKKERGLPAEAGKLILGFLIGISPWSIFSIIHFGRIWASDNNWVSASAYKAFVLDYPASATATVANEPVAWAFRIAKNILPLIKSVAKTYLQAPISALCGLLAIYYIDKRRNGAIKQISAVCVLAMLSTSPYLLTGYFDSRYFSLSILVLTILSLWLLSSEAIDPNETRRVQRALIIAVLLAGLIASRAVLGIAVSGIRNADEVNKESTVIGALAQRHKAEVGTTYIFMPDKNPTVNPFKYGALTQLRTAIRPSNFDSMTSKSKKEYFDSMRPFKIISDQSGK